MAGVEKRPRDDATESLIQEVLESEQAAKRAKKGLAPNGRPQRAAAAALKTGGKKPGKTLAEIEDEEGGPVKESLIGVAHLKRASNRKKAVDPVAKAAAAALSREDYEDVDVAEIAAVEEEAEEDEDDGDDDDDDDEEDRDRTGSKKGGRGVGRHEQAGLAVDQDEEGQLFEPFNLRNERAQGFFDEEGNYVVRKEVGQVEDAWLDSTDAQPVSDAVRAAHEARTAAAAAAAAARESHSTRAPLTERQLAVLNAEAASIMLPGETLTRALRRLGGSADRPPLGKRGKQQKPPTATAAGAGGSSVADRASFERLAEVADELLAEGEMDVYSTTREQFERTARVWLPQEALLPKSAAAGTAEQAKRGQAAVAVGAAAGRGGGVGTGGGDMFGDDDDDIFADTEKAATAAPPPAAASVPSPVPTPAAAAAAGQPSQPAATSAANGGAGQSGNHASLASNAAAASTDAAVVTAPAAASSEEVDFGAWPIKELKRFLTERGHDVAGIVEKADLVARAKEASSIPPAGEESFTAPAGYAFDPTSGYFYSADADLYYDTKSGGYYQSATGKWFAYDAATSSYVEWTGQ